MKPRSAATHLLSVAALLHLPLATAQQLSYTTATVTQCYESSIAPAVTDAPQGSAIPGLGNEVCVTMPACPSCDCQTCSHTSIYVILLGAFCSTGTTSVPYTVTEVFAGMSAFPSFAAPTGVPYGFTVGVETCTVCGDTPITATLTYPSAGQPYVPGLAAPTRTPSPAASQPGGSAPAQVATTTAVVTAGASSVWASSSIILMTLALLAAF